MTTLDLIAPEQIGVTVTVHHTVFRPGVNLDLVIKAIRRMDGVGADESPFDEIARLRAELARINADGEASWKLLYETQLAHNQMVERQNIALRADQVRLDWIERCEIGETANSVVDGHKQDGSRVWRVVTDVRFRKILSEHATFREAIDAAIASPTNSSQEPR